MSEQKLKPSWNGLLSTSFAMLLLLAVFMGYQISRMFMAGEESGSGFSNTNNLIFIALFVGVLGSLSGLKINPKYFSLWGVLMCLLLIAHILAATGLFSLESLFAAVAVVFLVLGNLKLRKR